MSRSPEPSSSSSSSTALPFYIRVFEMTRVEIIEHEKERERGEGV
jgi:hypothetical protein